MRKVIHLLLITVSVLLAITLNACKSQAGHNKYREAKVRPSERQLNSTKKQLKRGEKNYKKQMRSSRKKLYGRRTDPGAPKSRK
jgi:hypothetical protein